MTPNTVYLIQVVCGLLLIGFGLLGLMAFSAGVAILMRLPSLPN